MERAEYLDQLITKYSFDEMYEVYELCVYYYASITGIELPSSIKENLQNTIYLRPALSIIRDNADTLIDMFNKMKEQSF